MTFGSLFAGIGGFDLGFERAGLECRWQVEIDPYCQRVLAKHWPHVWRHDDVRTFPPEPVGNWTVDVICGGFPCQDISYAGEGAGIEEGTRSGLWAEYHRIIRVVRPRFVVVENVAALLARGMGRVLGDLAASGYDAEWDCIPASAVGAPHRRDRVFIVAHAKGDGLPLSGAGNKRLNDHPPRPKWFRPESGRDGSGCDAKPLPDLEGVRRRKGRARRIAGAGAGEKDQAVMGHAHRSSPHTYAASGEQRDSIGESSWWRVEPAVGRVADGVPDRVDRLRGLGNAVVPQVAEWIGRRLMEAIA